MRHSLYFLQVIDKGLDVLIYILDACFGSHSAALSDSFNLVNRHSIIKRISVDDLQQEKRGLQQMRTRKAQISLRISAGWSEPPCPLTWLMDIVGYIDKRRRPWSDYADAQVDLISLFINGMRTVFLPCHPDNLVILGSNSGFFFLIFHQN